MGQGGSAEPQRSPFDDQDATPTANTPTAAEASHRLTLIPTVLQWSHGGRMVYVTGTFNNWAERIPMRQSRSDFTVCLNLPVGTFQYKFIVDNEWRFSPTQPLVQDAQGNVNNCITVLDEEVRGRRARRGARAARSRGSRRARHARRRRPAQAPAGALRTCVRSARRRASPRASTAARPLPASPRLPAGLYERADERAGEPQRRRLRQRPDGLELRPVVCGRRAAARKGPAAAAQPAHGAAHRIARPARAAAARARARGGTESPVRRHAPRLTTAASLPRCAAPAPLSAVAHAQRIVLNFDPHLTPPTLAEEYPLPLPCTLLHLCWCTLGVAAEATAGAADVRAARVRSAARRSGRGRGSPARRGHSSPRRARGPLR